MNICVHRAMGNANKNLSKKKKSSDSLTDISGQTISGGMGEHKDGTDDSRHFFADDENATSTEINLDAEKQNKCLRCAAELNTRARYCRQCYEERRNWMPLRPTRKVTTSRSTPQIRPIRRTRSHQSADGEVLFVPKRKSQTHMKGERYSPNPMYSNLPKPINRLQAVSSSDSDFDFERERKHARAERREYFKHLQATATTDTTDYSTTTTDEEKLLCGKCRIRPHNAFIVHGESAHASLCYICASELLRTNAPCPECGRKIDNIVKKNIY